MGLSLPREHMDEHYRVLYTISQALHRQQGDAAAILRTTLWLAQQAVNAERGLIVRFNEAGTAIDSYSPETDLVARDGDFWGPLLVLVQQGRVPVAVDDLSVDRPWLQEMGSVVGSAAALPLVSGDRLHGALLLWHPTPHTFDTACMGLLEQAAETAALALDNAARLEMLAGSHTLYRHLYQESPFALILTDLQGEIIDANPKAYNTLGFDKQALIGLPISAVLRVGSGSGAPDNLQKAASGKEIEFTALARRARGEALTVRVFGRRIRLEAQNHIVWAMQDITQQAQQEQARRDLAAMTFHDLRGPLHNINGSLGRLEKLVTGDQSAAFVQLITLALQSTRQLTRMVNSLLDVDRLETGKAVLERRLTTLSVLLSEAAELLQMAAAEAGQSLYFDIDDSLPPLSLDSDMILRVIINLVENAIKHTPDGGHILVAAHGQAGTVVISVSDNGPGIPPEMREQVFDKYVRVKHKQLGRGLGLGLAFCRLAVEAHEGRIWVETDPQTQGARFSFTLPVEAQWARKPARRS